MEKVELENWKNSWGDIIKSTGNDLHADVYTFGEIVQSGQPDSLNENSTDITEILRFISETYQFKNLAAVVLASDGIFTGVFRASWHFLINISTK